MSYEWIERLFVELFLEAHANPPKQIVLDLDATDDPVHGHQEGRFFHGYYDAYCYLPLYVFCGRKSSPATVRGRLEVRPARQDLRTLNTPQTIAVADAVNPSEHGLLVLSGVAALRSPQHARPSPSGGRRSAKGPISARSKARRCRR